MDIENARRCLERLQQAEFLAIESVSHLQEALQLSQQNGSLPSFKQEVVYKFKEIKRTIRRRTATCIACVWNSEKLIRSVFDISPLVPFCIRRRFDEPDLISIIADDAGHVLITRLDETKIRQFIFEIGSPDPVVIHKLRFRTFPTSKDLNSWMQTVEETYQEVDISFYDGQCGWM